MVHALCFTNPPPANGASEIENVSHINFWKLIIILKIPFLIFSVKSQAQSREQHDAFHSQLEKSDDGFAVVADYFGRGMFRGQTFLESAVSSASGGRGEHQVDRRSQTASVTSSDRIDRRGQPTDGGYLQPTTDPVRKSPVPVIEEKPISVTTR